MITTGIRVSELVTLRRLDLSTSRHAHIAVTGKGRKHRIMPLDKTTASTLAAWTQANPAPPDNPLFPARGRRGPMSSDAVAQRVALHSGQRRCPGPVPQGKDRHPSHAEAYLRDADGLPAASTSPPSPSALGHASPAATRHYLHADLGFKQRALERTAPPRTMTGRYTPPDKVLAFLAAL